MTRRRLLLLGLAVVVLAVAGVAAAAAFIPEERVAAAVAARAEAVLGQPVALEGVSLRVLPIPGVRLEGVRVGPSDTTAVAAAEVLEVRVRLLPLFRGRVVVDRLDLVRPRVLLAIDSAGRSNLPRLMGDSAAPAPAGTAPARGIAFAVDQIRVEDGRLAYRDDRDGTALRLDGWDQALRLTGRVEGGTLAQVSFSGWAEFDDVDTRLPDVVIPARDLAVRVTHDATLDRAADRLDVRELSLTLNGVTLSGEGVVRGVSEGASRSVALRLRGSGIELRELLAWAPADLRDRLALPDGRAVDVTGSASIQVEVDGPLRPDSLPPFHGTLTLADAGAAVEDDALVSGVRGEAAFSADSVVARLNGSALGDRFSAAVALRDPRSRSVVAAVDGRVDLERLSRLGLVSDTLGLDGAVRADLQVFLPLDEPARSRAEGSVQVTRLRLAGVDPAVAIPAATFTLRGDEVRVEDLPVEVASGTPVATTLRVDLLVSRWLPALLDSLAGPPSVVALVEGDTLDLDRILGPSEGGYAPLLFARLRDRPLDGASAAELAAAAGLSLPDLPPVEADVRLALDRLVRNGLSYDDVEASARLTPDRVEVTGARFGLMGGGVQLRGRLETTARDSAGRPLRALLVGEYALEDLRAGSFFDRLTPFRDHLAGQLGLAGTFAMQLDSVALPDRSSVEAGGTIDITDGRLSNWRVLRALGGRLGLPAFDTIAFQDWAGVFGVTGTLVTLDETVLDGQGVDVRAAGSFDLGGALDLGATVYLSRELAARAGAVGQQISALAGTDGRVPVGIRIRGTAEDPAVELDLSQARSSVVARAREAAQAEARELTQQAARRALERLELPDSLLQLPPDSLRKVVGDSLYALLPDSARARGDSLRAQAEQALRNRLRRLLPGGGGGGNPPLP